MQIISFEGIDGAGKATQSQKLKEYLESKGYTAHIESFPRYKTEIGSLIKNILNSSADKNAYALHLLFEVDRCLYSPNISVLDASGLDYLILDRYVLSNLAYTKLADYRLYHIIKQIQEYLYKPDIVVYIDIEATESGRRTRGTKDMFEKNIKLQAQARTAYQELIAQNTYSARYITVSGKSAPIDIHKSIVKALEI